MIAEILDRFVDMRFLQKVSPLALFQRKLQSIPIGALKIPDLTRDSAGSRDDNVHVHTDDPVIR